MRGSSELSAVERDRQPWHTKGNIIRLRLCILLFVTEYVSICLDAHIKFSSFAFFLSRTSKVYIKISGTFQGRIQKIILI